MASVERSVKRAILEYPGLFQTPAQVLAHAFTVLGGGYHWTDEGDLADRIDDAATLSEIAAASRAKIRERIEDSGPGASDRHRERLSSLNRLARRIDEIASPEAIASAGSVSLYPIERRSTPIFTLPDHAQDDWLRAARSFSANSLALLLANRREQGEHDAWIDAFPDLITRFDRLISERAAMPQRKTLP